MGDPPDVRRIFAVSSTPKAVNDNPYPPLAEPPPPPPPDPRLTQRLKPQRPFRDWPIHADDIRDGICASAPGAPPLKDAEVIEKLKIGLRAYVEAEEGEGNVVKQQPDARDEVLRMAREDLGYKRLTHWRAMEHVVRPTWEAMKGSK